MYRSIDMSRKLSIKLLLGLIIFLMCCSTGALDLSAAVFSKSYFQTAEVRNSGSIARSDWLGIQTGGIFNEGGGLFSDGDLFIETGGTLTNQAAVAFVNNQGDLAATLEQLGSDASLQALLSSMLTAGLTTQFTEMTGIGADLPKDAPLTQRITQDIQQGIVESTVEAGVTSAVYGEDFGDAFVTSLRSKAAETLGEHVAGEIGSAVKDGDMDTAGQMIAHAALGCAMGSIASDDCASGATGAVIGETVGLLYAEKIKEWAQDTKNGTLDKEEVFSQLKKMKNDGVDIVKLASGFAVALGGGDVNLAAMTGGNAAENNALITATTIAVIAFSLELVDKAIVAYEVAQLADAVSSGDEERATELAKDLSISLGIELTAGQFLPGSAIAGMLAKYTKKVLKNKGLDDLADSFQDATKHWDNPKKPNDGLDVVDKNTPNKTLTNYYPDNNGFLGTTERQFLLPGQTIDRYGGSGYSRFFSPAGTPEAVRALPYGTAGQPLRRFEVVKPVEVDAGTVSPWFGQPGGGTQFVTPIRLETLLKRGILKEVTP